MSLALKIYEAFKDDEARERLLSEVIDDLDRRIIPMEQISTKGYLEVTTLTLKKEIEEVRLTLKKEIEEVCKEIEKVKSGLIRWVTGVFVVQTGVIVTIIALLK